MLLKMEKLSIDNLGMFKRVILQHLSFKFSKDIFCHIFEEDVKSEMK